MVTFYGDFIHDAVVGVVYAVHCEGFGEGE